MSQLHRYCTTDTLYAACPSCQSNQKHYTYWYHSGCGSKTCICWDDIHVFCSGCSTNDIIFRWNFSCGNHDFKKAGFQGILYALNILTTTYGREQQIQNALRLVTSEYRKYQWALIFWLLLEYQYNRLYKLYILALCSYNSLLISYLIELAKSMCKVLNCN